MDLDARMNQFRVASRELFNQFFRADDPYNNDQAWPMEERYSEVQELLFQKLVLEPAGLPPIAYGLLNSSVVVALRHGDFAPIMLNREVDSGYWDHPLREVTRDANDPLVCVTANGQRRFLGGGGACRERVGVLVGGREHAREVLAVGERDVAPHHRTAGGDPREVAKAGAGEDAEDGVVIVETLPDFAVADPEASATVTSTPTAVASPVSSTVRPRTDRAAAGRTGATARR